MTEQRWSPLEPLARRVFDYYALGDTDGELSPNEVMIALIELGHVLSFDETERLVVRLVLVLAPGAAAR